MPNIPNRADELTPGWLTTALHEQGCLEDGKVERVAIEILDPSVGVYGTIVRLHLESSSASPGLPSTMIAKLPSSNPDAAKRLRSIGGDETEVNFYLQIGESIGLRIPECYFSAWDKTTGRFIILLEDLSRFRYAGTGLDLTDNEMTATVKTLAASHAAWWQHPRLPDLKWLGSLAADPALQLSAFLEAWPVVVDRLGEGVPGLGPLGRQIELTMRQFQERLSSAPVTLLNVDHRQENLFFAGDAESPVPIFIDWQMLRFGRGPIGLAAFLALTPQRNCMEDTLVRLYHSELEGAGIRDYSFQNCLQDYCLGILRRFSVPTATLATVDPDSPQGTAILDALARFGMDNLERYLTLIPEE